MPSSEAAAISLIGHCPTLATAVRPMSPPTRRPNQSLRCARALGQCLHCCRVDPCVRCAVPSDRADEPSSDAVPPAAVPHARRRSAYRRGDPSRARTPVDCSSVGLCRQGGGRRARHLRSRKVRCGPCAGQLSALSTRRTKHPPSSCSLTRFCFFCCVVLCCVVLCCVVLCCVVLCCVVLCCVVLCCVGGHVHCTGSHSVPRRGVDHRHNGHCLCACSTRPPVRSECCAVDSDGHRTERSRGLGAFDKKCGVLLSSLFARAHLL
jgi:hypothetical protein